MSQQPQQMMPQPMPEDEGWHEINAGPHLRMMFHPNRRGRMADEIERPSIVVALAGQHTQLIRLDPFSQGAHYHIRPRQSGQQLPLEVKEGQTPLAAALDFFEEPDRFRGLLAAAEQTDVAAHVQNADLRNAAQQIRSIKAAAGHLSAA
jgi:hypothetical protein